MENLRTAGNNLRTAVIVDRYPLWVGAVARVLGMVEVAVVGTATSWDTALTLVEEAQPTLLVCDLMGGGVSLKHNVLVDVLERSPKTQIVVLAASRDRADIDAAFTAGAVVYVVKSANAVDLASAVRQCFQKSLYFTHASGPIRVAASVAANGGPKPAADLTRRESEILSLVAEGYSNAQLARMLWVTEQTVKFHLSNIYRKIHVANRTEAGRWAQLHGLVTRMSQQT
jgi:DNA-binding NarL/FixJ family response regulator